MAVKVTAKWKASTSSIDKGTLELATFINEPTNKFAKLGSFVYGIVSFHDGKIRVPARLTDQLLCDSKNLDLASFEGREVIPRFRRRYSVGKSDIIPTISLAFTLSRRILSSPRIQNNPTNQRLRVARYRRLWRLLIKVPL